MESVYLHGAEDVRSAASSMSHAAESIRSAASSIDSTSDMFFRQLDDRINRFDSIVERLEKALEKAMALE